MQKLGHTRGTLGAACLLFLFGCSGGDDRGGEGVAVDAAIDAPSMPDSTAPPPDASDDARPPMTDGELPPTVDAEPEGGMSGGSTACLEAMYMGPPSRFPGPDYDRFSPTVGSHCVGTNHQDITGVERVVFLGDSITVGSPPTLTPDMYRVRLASQLTSHFGLTAPGFLWENVNLVDGVTLARDGGSFSSCAKWGARTDDFLPESASDRNYQVGDCFRGDGPFRERTLVVITMGGNDISNVTQDGAGDSPERTVEQSWEDTRAFVQRMRDAIDWLKEPGRFPAGVFVVFTNMYEFTDATGSVSSCPAAGLVGIDDWSDPTALAAMVVWANEQYLRMAVETGTDMVFMMEGFCGHGFERNNAESMCYRGPGSDIWFDLSCVHPNPAGHHAIADMFMAVVRE